MKQKLIVDLFAGGGGVSEGIFLATGRHPDIAINHSEDALSMHQVNHPHTRHFIADVYDVCPLGATQGKPVGWLHLSPDCFPAGTMVLTREGYRPIEQIAIGDEVLTHLRRWRKVTRTFSSIKPLLEIRGQGHPGLLVSPEHPFYARQRRDVWDTTPPRGYRRTLDDVEWRKAGNLGRGWYWATPAEFPKSEAPKVPAYRGRTLAISEQLMKIAGRYVADGWTRIDDNRAELVITCGQHKIAELRKMLNQWERSGARCSAEEIAWHERETGTAYQFSTNCRGLVEWLRTHFGHGAAEKRIPGWALGMDKLLRNALLEGYLSGDGCEPKCEGSQIVICTTVSKALAFGIKSLAASLGNAASVYIRTNQSDVIQGRKVNVLPAWSIRWRPNRDRAQSFFDDGMEWAPIREVRPFSTATEVFNISVADDESYVVEGIVVHNCTHHSQASGGQPRSKKIRGLAWVGYRWADQVKPDVISLENVTQILKWGPLIAKRDQASGRVVTLDMVTCPATGRKIHRIADPGERVPVQRQYLVPDPLRAGQTWRRFTSELRKLGYDIEYRTLCAADYGSPTTRERLFMIARRDGQPINWPEPTHFKNPAAGQAKWRAAAECIDFSIPCQSIFNRKKPLADATMKRIAKGLQRYVLDNADPFIVQIAHYNGSDRTHSISDPLKTITAGTKGGEFALASPIMVSTANTKSTGRGPAVWDIEEPARTVTASGGLGLAAPIIVQAGHGEGKPGSTQRLGVGAMDMEYPLGTVASSGGGFSLSTAYLAQMNGGFNETTGRDLRDPMTTITNSGSQQQVVAAHLTHLRRNCDARDINEPVRTISAGGEHHGAVSAFLSRQFGNSVGQPVTEPAPTIMTDGLGKTAVVSAFISSYYTDESNRSRSMKDPAATITTENRLGLVECRLSPEHEESAQQVAAFLMRYYSEGGQHNDITDPMATITTKDRLALVTVTIEGHPYIIVDIGLRMLQPVELFRAQGFRNSYQIEHGHDGRKFTKTTQVRLCGNSVPPELMAALVRANHQDTDINFAKSAA